MDGSDEANEGEWIFTSSTETERLYLTHTMEVDTFKNCLQIAWANELQSVSCGYTAGRALVCESEGDHVNSRLS